MGKSLKEGKIPARRRHLTPRQAGCYILPICSSLQIIAVFNLDKSSIGYPRGGGENPASDPAKSTAALAQSNTSIPTENRLPSEQKQRKQDTQKCYAAYSPCCVRAGSACPEFCFLWLAPKHSRQQANKPWHFHAYLAAESHKADSDSDLKMPQCNLFSMHPEFPRQSRRLKRTCTAFQCSLNTRS